ncbi:MAG: MFS transporter [Alphaproteobacteria bacterium]|nr:MAG: MFS transporter [Alphaproteobacteria bacterium]
MMFAGLRSVWVLLLGVAILSLGHGLHGSLIGVRASAENFDAATTGLIMSGYFAGLLLSSIVTPRIVQSVGHIRVFAAFASVVSTAVLLIPLWVQPTWWFLMRFVAGLCTSGLFIVCESWLNSVSTNKNRGQLLSIYMIVTYAAMGLGQLLLNVPDSSGFSRFIIVSALLSMAMLPLTLMRSETPSLAGIRSVTLAEIYRSSPLAIVATLASGMAQSAFFSMGAVYALMQGLPLSLVSVMMALPPLALIISQYPAGLLSDRYDRRSVIMILSAIAAAIALISIPAATISSSVLIALFTAFGAIALPIYSLVIAHANDHMAKEQMLGASSKLVLLYGTGAMAGPSIAGQFMQHIGSPGFMTFMALIYAIMAVHALWRRRQRPTTVKASAGDIMKAGPLTTPVAAQAQAEEGSARQQVAS